MSAPRHLLPVVLLAGLLLVPVPAHAATTVSVVRAGSMASWGPLTSTGAGLRKQSVEVAVPAGWKLTLDGRSPDYTDTVLVPEGFYSQDSPTKVTFTPNAGFLGRATPVTIRITGPGGPSRTSTYAATVTKPPPPAAPNLRSSGRSRAPQQVGFPLPVNGSHGYVDPTGKDLGVLNVPQGAYSAAAISGIATEPGRPMDPTLIAATGFLIFTPRRGFSGPVPPIRYRITDAYGQTSIGRWTPTVTGY
jgi:CshA-type fibril repeat protein